MAIRERVFEQAILIESWATVTNYDAFYEALWQYYNRAGTAFSTAYYRLLRYAFAERILEELTADHPEHLPPLPDSRPRGYYNVALALGDDGAGATLDEIETIKQSEYNAGLETDGGMPPIYTSTHCERWASALKLALDRATSDLNALGDYLEDRYEQYYAALTSGGCGRVWLSSNVRIEEICWSVYGGRGHEGFAGSYGIMCDEPVEIREMLNGDDD